MSGLFSTYIGDSYPFHNSKLRTKACEQRLWLGPFNLLKLHQGCGRVNLCTHFFWSVCLPLLMGLLLFIDKMHIHQWLGDYYLWDSCLFDEGFHDTISMTLFWLVVCNVDLELGYVCTLTPKPLGSLGWKRKTKAIVHHREPTMIIFKKNTKSDYFIWTNAFWAL